MSTTNRFTFPGTSLTVGRMGYGAMQLAGPGVWGPPRDMDGAIAVLREVVAAGVNHVDTSDYYGPHITNQIIKKALHSCEAKPGGAEQGQREPEQRRELLDVAPQLQDLQSEFRLSEVCNIQRNHDRRTRTSCDRDRPLAPLPCSGTTLPARQ